MSKTKDSREFLKYGLNTKGIKDQRQFLADIGLNPDAPNLVPDQPAKTTKRGKAVLAPEGVDPHVMPVEQIVFDPVLLDGFSNLEDADVRKDATDHIFRMYKSKHRDKPRNSLLWRQISKFINEQRMSRKTGGHVKEKVKVSREQSDLAQTIAALGLTAEDLIELAKQKKEG